LAGYDKGLKRIVLRSFIFVSVNRYADQMEEMRLVGHIALTGKVINE
jgi:hypothetical protein